MKMLFCGRRVGRENLKRAIILAAAALSACQQHKSNQARGPTATVQDELKVASKVADLRIVRIGRLPANPNPAPVDDYCSSVGYGIHSPKSPGGQLAASRGWIVTAETKLGKYDAVTFVGGLDAGTSAVCYPKNGNLAVFDGSHLQAIAYSMRPSKYIVGTAWEMDERRIRLADGTPDAPFADVVLRDGILVEPTAPEDPVCGGSAVIPNIYNQGILQARKKLLAYGWRPKRPAEPLNGGMDEALKAQGVIEVEACAGTGWGPCRFNYVHSKGATLAVVSRGEDSNPPIISAEASCNGD
jgi:hypothetical protein